MIHPLRVRHARIWAVLPVLLIGMLAVSVIARRPLPNAEEAGAETPAAESGRDLGVILDNRLRVHLRAAEGAGSAVVLSPETPFSLPDVLVYVSNGPVEDGNLLGVLNGATAQTLALPAGTDEAAQLIFYSLPDQEELDRLTLNRGERAP